MKVNLEQYSDVDVESTTMDMDITLSKDSASMVFQIFTKNMYSNPIGSIVREITSNCFDSHIEAGVNLPVIIRKIFDKLTKTYYISFIDFGVGMSPTRIKDVFAVMFNSTKRQDENQIGQWGLGSKVPLAYKRKTGFGEEEYDNSYNIITIYNGFKYTYLVYDSKQCPRISEPSIEFTKEPNGTEVRVPILEKDLGKFKKEMIRQLYYFENIIFEGFDDVATDINLTNEYQIVKAKTFLYRGEEYSTNVHVCLGKVAYPLDYDVLGIDRGDYNFPIAIRLNIGEINVVPSRESLNYNEAAIKLLKSKLLAVKAELVEMLSKQYENIITLEDYFKVKNNFGHVYFPNGKSIDMGETIEQKDIDFSGFRYNFMKMPNDKQLFRFFFESKLYGKKEVKGRRSWRYNSSNDNDTQAFEGSYEVLIAKKKALYYFNGEFERKIVKQAWLKEQHTRYYMITKIDLTSHENRVHIMELISDLFNVYDKVLVRDKDGITTNEPTAYAKSLMEMQDEYFEIVKANCSDYESVIVPESFIESRKREKITEEMRKITIPAKIISTYSQGQRVKLDALFKFNGTIFYGLKEEEDKLKLAAKTFGLAFNAEYIVSGYNTFRSPKKPCILFIRIAAGNVRYMEFCRKAYHINYFKVKMMYRKETMVLDYFCSVNFVNKYNQLDNLYRHNGFKNICQKWGKKIAMINAFISKLQTSTRGKNWSSYTWELGHYFDLRDIAMTKEQQEFKKTIEELQEMQEVNADTMKFINQPYNFNTGDDLAYWNLLKKVLAY